MFSDEAFRYAGLIEVRDGTPHTLRRDDHIDPADVDEANHLRAVFALRAAGFSDSDIDRDLGLLS